MRLIRVDAHKKFFQKPLKPTIYMYIMLLIYHIHFDILKDDVNTVSFNATVKQLEH